MVAAMSISNIRLLLIRPTLTYVLIVFSCANVNVNVKTETDSTVEPDANVSENFEIISVNRDTLSKLKRQRQDNDDMCDVILQVENTEFSAHRLLLSASNDYFFKMFTIDMQEKHNKKVSIKSITREAMGEILNSICSNEIAFSKLNISDILHGVSLMQYSAIALSAA